MPAIFIFKISVAPTGAGRELFVKRSVKIDVIPPDNKRREVINSIRLYRAACRKAYTACSNAEMAGAEIIMGDDDIQIKPNSDNAKQILELAFGVTGKAHLYQLRVWIRDLHPTWMSIVPESIHRDIVSPRWRAKDPEFPKATRGYLTLNGARAHASFMRVGIYFKNTVPKISADKRCVSLKWDYDIGEVDFRIPKLDGSRYGIWKSLCEQKEGWKPGGMFLSEKDNKIFLVLSFECPDPVSEIDVEKVLSVTINEGEPENYITASCENKRFSSERVSILDAVNWLDRLNIIREKYQKQLAAAKTGRKHNGGYKIVASKLNTQSEKRSNGQKSFNHLWTRRIIQHAIRTKCGTIVLSGLPEKELSGHPWGWYQFKEMLKYKITELGGKLQNA